MAITPNHVYNEISIYTPNANTLTQPEIESLIQKVMNTVGSEDEDLPEVGCKSLQSIATVNMIQAGTNTAGIKKETVGDNTIEYTEGSSAKEGWKTYLDSLRDICPLLGYYGLKAKGGIKITTSPTPNINPSCYPHDLEF